MEAAKPLKKRGINAHWTTQELVTIGIFASVIKATTVLVAMAGGGMNPLTLLLKNCIFTMLIIVLMHKVPKTGTLTLVTFITALVSFLLMGQGVLHTPGALVTCLIAEAVIYLLGGYKKTRNILIGVFLSEMLSKAIGLGLSALMLREQPALLVPVMLFVIIGSFGCVIGLWCGKRFTEELRHAGIISYQ